jgi:CBS domain-containing protein
MTAVAAFPSLDGLSVADAMHPGLISCPPDTPLRAAARMMATYRVHAVLVTAHAHAALPDVADWGIVTDTDLLRAAADVIVDEQAVRTIGAAPSATLAPHDSLVHAAETMMAGGLAHVIVVDPESERPVGILSTLDVARALAGFPERHPAG